MVSVTKVLLFATGALALAVPRDITTTLSDLANIDAKLLEVKAALTNYDGILTGLPVDIALFGLNGAISDATDRVSKSASVTEAEAKQVIDYVDDTLQPDVKATIDELLVKAPIFKENGEGFFAYLYCANLKDLTTKYADALLSKAPESSQAAGRAALQAVIAEIDRAIDTFK